MKTLVVQTLTGIFLAMAVLSCAPGQEPESTADMVSADTVQVAGPGPESNAAMPLNSPERKLIHTANLQAEVKNLYEATSRIESATLGLGGQVSTSTMRKELLETRHSSAGGDSVAELRRYVGTASLSLRVPVARLDTLLRYIATQTAFIDVRQLQIDDATFRHLENALRSKKLGDPGTTVEGASKADGPEARQYLDRLRMEAVTRQVENLRVDDQAAYASLALELRQPEEIVTQMLPDIAQVMQAGPGARFTGSLRQGWELFYDLIIGLLSVWPLTLAGAVVAVILLRRSRGNKTLGRAPRI